MYFPFDNLVQQQTRSGSLYLYCLPAVVGEGKIRNVRCFPNLGSKPKWSSWVPWTEGSPPFECERFGRGQDQRNQIIYWHELFGWNWLYLIFGGDYRVRQEDRNQTSPTSLQLFWHGQKWWNYFWRNSLIFQRRRSQRRRN